MNIQDEMFTATALKIFNYQHTNNKVYHDFCENLNINPGSVKSMEKIPFLPVSFFKTHRVVSGDFEPEIVFKSSSTTGIIPSTHEVKDVSIYERSFIEGFKYFYGDPSQYTFLALLPSYSERADSSLIYMIDKFINLSIDKTSGYFLYDHERLYDTLIKRRQSSGKTILFGVTYALLYFADNFKINFPELLLFETGGMKGRKKEIVKEEVHAILKNAFGVNKVHSEYGMCELLSQIYSKGDNIFYCPPWVKILFRDERDFIDVSSSKTYGAINIIDFANINSCSFLATDDIGKLNSRGVEILGRLDGVEARGCNLLISSF